MNFLSKQLSVRGTTLRLSKATGISRSQLQRYMDGSSWPDTEALEKIADFFKIPAFHILMSPAERKLWDRKNITEMRLPESLSKKLDGLSLADLRLVEELADALLEKKGPLNSKKTG